MRPASSAAPRALPAPHSRTKLQAAPTRLRGALLAMLWLWSLVGPTKKETITAAICAQPTCARWAASKHNKVGYTDCCCSFRVGALQDVPLFGRAQSR